jgi:clan AA aspartic protease
MMTGNVVNLHVLLSVVFRLPNQPNLTIEFVVDTGFTGFLTLPPAAVAAMELPFLHRVPADLADASTIELNVYAATIVWNDVARQVPVLALGRRPLLGTALLENCELLIQFVEGGLVTVDGL